MNSSSFTYYIKTPDGGVRELAFNADQLPKAGQIYRLSGSNGAGKTTLLQLLSGLLPPAQGKIPYAQDHLFFLPHHPGVRRNLSAWDNLDYWAAINDLNVKHYVKEIDKIIELIELKDLLHVSLYQLSAGQQRRASLLRLGMVAQRRVWLLDEPETSLDQNTIQKLGAIVTAYADAGGAVIWASHYDLPTRLDGEIAL